MTQNPTTKRSVLLVKIGGTLWVVLVGVSVILVLLHWLGVIDAQAFDWRLFATICGVGGLACFVLAGIVAIWEGLD